MSPSASLSTIPAVVDARHASTADDPGMDPRLIALANQQGGAFTVHQAQAFHHISTVRRWEVNGTVGRVSRSVRSLTVDQRETTADGLRRARLRYRLPLAAVFHSAASLQGFGVVADPYLHIAALDARFLEPSPGVVVHQVRRRSPLVGYDDLIATDPADTAIDVASAAAEIDVLAVLDAALRAGVSRPELDRAVVRAHRQRGIIAVRRWAAYADPRAQSPMESRTRQRILAAGLPAPNLQVPVRTASGRVRFLDNGWEDAKVGVDYEGDEFHTGTGAMARDRIRHNDVNDTGWRMFYPVASTIYHDHVAFVQMLGRALGHQPTLGGRVCLPAIGSVPRNDFDPRMPPPVIWGSQCG